MNELLVLLGYPPFRKLLVGEGSKSYVLQQTNKTIVRIRLSRSNTQFQEVVRSLKTSTSSSTLFLGPRTRFHFRIQEGTNNLLFLNFRLTVNCDTGFAWHMTKERR